MTYYLLPWLQHIDVRGLASLGDEFTDYAPGYTYILLLASKISAWIPPVSSVKLMSVAADCVMAIVGGLLVARISNNALRGGLTAAVLVALPTVVLNSAVWGQSDSIWTGAAVACVLAMSCRRPIAAVLCFGLAVAFKPQAIFLGPLLVGFLISCRAWPLLPLVALPYTLLALPMLMAGRDAPSVFLVYLSQATSPAEPATSNAASLWAWLPASLEPLVLVVGVIIAIMVGVGLVLVSCRSSRLAGDQLVTGAALCCTLMPFLLPKMHDRYFYAGEVFTAISMCLRPSLLSAFVGSQTAGLLTYQIFLLGLSVWRVQVAAIFNLLVCIILFWAWVNRSKSTG
jgi:Gpi18-like mannosyltransferase